MGLFISPVVAVFKALWVPVSKRIGYFYHLKEKIQSLENETKDLSARRADVSRRVEREEEGQCSKRTSEVANWLQKVQVFEGQVGDVLREDRERDQMNCLRRCFPGNCWSTYNLGKKVYRMLNKVKGLQSQGKFDVDTFILPPPPVRQIPSESTVGLEALLSEVWKCLVQEDDVGIIGLYGMGGVGKTTLMTRINNELSQKANDFSVVIWVVISKQVNLEKIQDSIRRRLKIKDKDWSERNGEEKTGELFRILSNTKFVLLIDDVWNRLDLLKVGVPHPNSQNKSKIIFTTRLKQVCNQMAADKSFQVRCLTSEDALQLFEKNVGKETLNSHPEISKFVEAVAQECKGLPLALVTVGRAMAGRMHPSDWEYSLEVLRTIPSEISGMVDDVFHLLEFSYKSLNNAALQRCFLYCCIFPEDYSIQREYLINLWIGEGLLGEIDDVHKQRKKGEHFIESLKLACLIEGSDEDTVKMHDVIRDMARWIACDKGKENDRILLEEDERELSKHTSSKWRKAERIFVVGSKIKSIGQAPSVTTGLRTLIVRETGISCLPLGFFISMKDSLVVLDFSNNENLKELPGEIGELHNLQHLDLSNTSTSALPHELSKLTQLRCLILDKTYALASISTKLISSLSTLNMFSQWMEVSNVFTWESKNGLLEALGSAEKLTDVSILVYTPDCALTLFNHPSLRRSIKRAAISFCKDLTSFKIKFSSSHGSFLHLEDLVLYKCTTLMKIEIARETQAVCHHTLFSNLRRVSIRRCNALTDLSWLILQAQNLQTLMLKSCGGIEEIVSGRLTAEASSLFSSLTSLDLNDLPSLTRIYDHVLPFPSLQEISIGDCPKLRKLPLNSDSAKNTLRQIRAPDEWWNKLVWVNKDAELVFTSKLVPVE